MTTPPRADAKKPIGIIDIQHIIDRLFDGMVTLWLLDGL